MVFVLEDSKPEDEIGVASVSVELVEIIISFSPVVQGPSSELSVEDHILSSVISVSEEREGDHVDVVSLCEFSNRVEWEVCEVSVVVLTSHCWFVEGTKDLVFEVLSVLWVCEIQLVDYIWKTSVKVPVEVVVYEETCDEVDFSDGSRIVLGS